MLEAEGEMAELEIRLLGPLRVTVAGRPITEFKSNRARALLVYLAMESGKLHHRNVLAGTFWPDLPEQSALSNLRDNLSYLRKIVGDRASTTDASVEASNGHIPFFLVTRDTIQFNSQSDFFIDAVQFASMTRGEQPLDVIEAALALVNGEFLAGLTLKDSSAFENWLLFKREQINQQVYYTLRSAANTLEQNKRYEKALEIARRQLEFMPWSEETHRQLIRLYALSGNHRQALVQYEICKRALMDEMGVSPESATTQLYEQVRDGQFLNPTSPGGGARYFAAQAVAGPVQPISIPEESTPAWINRKPELQALDQHYQQALAGNGGVVFVRGDPGTGKSMLVRRFCELAIQSHPELLVAQGASSGPNDPASMYLPIREIIQMLCEPDDLYGLYDQISEEQIRRLITSAPQARETLQKQAPLLANLFLSARPDPQSTERLLRETQAVEGAPGSDPFSLRIGGLANEFCRALRQLSWQRPMILIFEDFQWVDPHTLSLLHSFCRRLANSRILVLGVARMLAESTMSQSFHQSVHAFINELCMKYGEICLDLNKSDGRSFVKTLLSFSPQTAGPEFCESFFQLTAGNALLAVDLCKDFFQTGILQMSSQDGWNQAQPPAWQNLPARVEALLTERSTQIDAAHQKLLATASIQGSSFYPAVVAAALHLPREEVEQAFAGRLSKHYHVVSAASIEQTGDVLVPLYRFTPGIFQQYWYQRLDLIERRYLHADTAKAMQMVFGSQAESNRRYAEQVTRHLALSGM